ncbi:hypothetical protein AAC387_Pa08g1788 [Persea americana]
MFLPQLRPLLLRRLTAKTSDPSLAKFCTVIPAIKMRQLLHNEWLDTKAFRRRVRIEERNPHVSVSGERRCASSLSFRWHKCTTRWELSTPQEMNFAAHVPTTAQASASEEAYNQDKIDSGS